MMVVDALQHWRELKHRLSDHPPETGILNKPDGRPSVRTAEYIPPNYGRNEGLVEHDANSISFG